MICILFTFAFLFIQTFIVVKTCAYLIIFHNIITLFCVYIQNYDLKIKFDSAVNAISEITECEVLLAVQ